MSLIAVWVDHKQANVFKFTQGGVKKEAFEGHFPEHHTHSSDNREEQKHEEQKGRAVVTSPPLIVKGAHVCGDGRAEKQRLERRRLRSHTGTQRALRSSLNALFV